MREQLLKKLLEYLQNTEDFVLEQVPEIVKEVLRYEKINAIVTALLMLILLGGLLSLSWYFWKNPTLDKWGSRDSFSFIIVFVPCVVSPLLFIQFCYSVDKLIQIYTAPKYFLIQMIKGA